VVVCLFRHFRKKSQLGVNVIIGYWHQRADKRLGNSPPRHSGAFSGRDMHGGSAREFGVSK